ncbi:hypothetical protein L798_12890 [Zootermopsis nevadensis]|uniref:Uncharacterized protein n=2 Tax=Zootermopsis nevadensis TaxID=136037 RepID=A0A067R219_ZOONE|nr:hypothetical protein L798_12890 [Zootermopsis nevadensis]
MDYSMQFQTFSQQECYAGQPRPSTSGYGGSKTNKDYYSRVRSKSSSTSHAATDGKIPRTSKSPPDGLSLEISCISSQQTLPVSVAAASSSSSHHRRNKSPRGHRGHSHDHQHQESQSSSSGVGFGRSRSCSMGTDHERDRERSGSDSSAGGAGSPRRSEPKAISSQYRLPTANHRTTKTPQHDSVFELDSSTESAEASPEVNHRVRRSGVMARRGTPSR